VCLPILGEIDESGVDGILRPADVDRPAPHDDLAASAPVGAVDEARELRAPGPDEAGEPEHLACVEREGAAPDARAVADVAHLEHGRVAHACRMVLLVEGGQVAPHHHAHDGIGPDLVAAERAHIGAVAQNRDTVGQFVDLGHAVGNVDDGQPLRPQLAHEGEETVRLARGKRRGRLVHDEDA